MRQKQTVTRFITNRAEGACAGKREDREEPHQWGPYQERMKFE